METGGSVAQIAAESRAAEEEGMVPADPSFCSISYHGRPSHSHNANVYNDISDNPF